VDVGGLQSVGAVHRLALPALILSAFVPLKRRCAASVPRDREQRMLRRLYRYTMCSLTTRHWLGQRWPVRGFGSERLPLASAKALHSGSRFVGSRVIDIRVFHPFA
jgi:hypothetical protein